MESVIAIGIVLLAVAGVAYGLYRNATSKNDCEHTGWLRKGE